MTTRVSERKLRSIVRESVKEALGTELMKLRALALPEISNKEQKDIERRYGKPMKRRARSFTLHV